MPKPVKKVHRFDDCPNAYPYDGAVFTKSVGGTTFGVTMARLQAKDGSFHSVPLRDIQVQTKFFVPKGKKKR